MFVVPLKVVRPIIEPIEIQVLFPPVAKPLMSR